MAKGGGKKRTYVRDGNGRFASSPGGGKPALKGGTLAKRSSLKGSRAKLAAKDKADPSIRNTLSTRSQKGAVTRGNKALRAAKASSQRTAVGRSKVGTVAKAKRSPVMRATALKPQAAMSGGKSGKALKGAKKALPVAKPAITSKTASAKTKGERIIDRITANVERASRESTSKNQEQKLARTLAVSNFAKSVISRRGVGSRDPSKQYSKQDLLPTLNKSLSKPLPKNQRKSTTKSKKDITPALIDLAAWAAKKTRDRAREKGLLLPPGNQPRRSTPAPNPTRTKGSRTTLPRTPGTIAKPKGLKPSPVNKAAAKPMKAAVQFRSRKQAASAQKERNRRLYEFAASAPGASIDIAISPGERSMKRKATNVSQGNLLTGRVDSVKANEKITFGRSRIGRSAIFKKNEQRRSRAEARYETLLQERKAIMRRGRVKGGELATNTQRMAAVSGAFRVYDMGTGRKPKRKSTGRQRVRNSGDLN